MSDGVCKASLQKISEGIGIDRATVQRHADKLCEAGYLKDLTPDLRNKPHIYVDTGKAGIRSTLKATVAESNVSVAESNATVAESQLKKVLKKDSKKEKKSAAPHTPPPHEILVYREVTNLYPPKEIWDSVVKIIQSVSKRLGRDATAEDLRPFLVEWLSRGWKKTNINWTSWAVSGVIPQQGRQPQPTQPKGVTAAMAWLNRQQEAVSNGD